MRRISLLMMVFSATVFAGDWVIPWVANKDATWASEMAIDNHEDFAVNVELTGIRPDGSQQIVGGISIPAGGQWVGQAGTVFNQLGSGSGYAVFVHADGEALSAGVKVSSLATSSGDSPALGYAMPLASGATRLVFQFMPFSQGGAAAPVIVNTTDAEAEVVIQAYGRNGLINSAQSTLQLGAQRPFADVLPGIFPDADISESTYLVVSSDKPLVGMSFNFNTIREPSMMNAQPLTQISEEDFNALFMTLNTVAVVTESYNAGTSGILGKDAPKRSCPDVSVDINWTNAESFIVADFDWGDGCSNIFGWHSGAASLHMEREGTVQDGGWMKGSLIFDEYTTRYLGSDLFINGATHMEGSTRTNNFVLTGEWEMSANVPVYWFHGTLNSSTSLNVNRRDGDLVAYGHIAVQASAYYYGAFDGTVSQDDPLVYEGWEDCIWPTSGRINVSMTYGYTVHGYLDFGTGDCGTATLNIGGQSTTLYLPVIN